MARRLKGCGIIVAVAGGLLLSPPALAQETGGPRYFVKPSDVRLPEGLGWGQYRRIIQPFENWTLICDEDLKSMHKVCNVTQSIVDQHDVQIFSWSLAATAAGKPMMILRFPSSIDQEKPLTVFFPGQSHPVIADLQGCDDTVCVATMPVGALTRSHIEKASDVTFGYVASGKTMVFGAPLKGITAALEAIQ